MIRLRLSIVVAVIACLAVVATGVAQASIGKPRTPRQLGSSSCDVVKLGAKRYILYRNHVSCGFAKPWAKRMADTRGASKPAGWACSSGNAFRSGGYCQRGGRHFGWHVGG